MKINQTDNLRIIKLKELIQKYDNLYYEQGISEISDAEYDRLYDEYLKFEEKYPELKEMDDAPTKRVGAGDEAGGTTLLPKYTHKSPLLSINKKAKELEELKAFYESIGGDGTEVIIEPKLDGITCNINYEFGKFANAATRGNGYIGDLITENFQQTDTFYPKSLGNSSLEIRGEAIISYDFFKENLSKDYSNPRNAVAGIMRSINPEDVKGKGVQVMFYDIGQTTLNLENSDLSNLYHISKLQFQTVPVISVSIWDELKNVVESKMNGSIQETDGFNVLMTEGKFPQAVCDGLVIKVNDITKRYQIGMTDKGPKWAFAYKFKPLRALTRIDHVEWQVGKSGRITPVAIFDEITLGGTKIAKATLNNYDYMQCLPILYDRRDVWLQERYDNWGERVEVPYRKPIERSEYILAGDIIRDSKTNHLIHVESVDKNIFTGEETFVSDTGKTFHFEKERYFLKNDNLGLQIDDTIVVERSNDVIPRIIAIHHRNKLLYPQGKASTERFEKRENSFNNPQTCPICGHPTVTEGPLTFCKNSLCQAQFKGHLEHFVSRDAMNIVGLGEAILDVFVDNGFIQEYADVYHLERYKEKILELDKFGIRKYNNLQKSIQNSMNPSLASFIYALGIPLVGKRMSKTLTNHYQTLPNFLKAEYLELVELEDVSGITANLILEFLDNSDNIVMIENLLKSGVEPQALKKDNIKQIFKDKTFVITGTLKNPRKYYQANIERKGGKVVGSVSKKTYAVLIGNDAGSKEMKAKELVKNGADIYILDSEEDIKRFLEL